MKNLVSILVCLVCLLPSKGQDTLFLFRKAEPGFYHAIFVAQKSDTKYHEARVNFEISGYSQRSLNDAIQDLKKGDPLPLNKYNLGKLPLHWCPITSYKDKFYLYRSVSSLYDYKISLTDSTLVFHSNLYMPEPRLLLSFQQLDAKTYEMEVSPLEREPYRLRIHLVNKKRGLAVFEYLNEQGKSSYDVLVQADKLHKYPMIVNYCKQERLLYEFDQLYEVDGEQLLKKKKK